MQAYQYYVDDIQGAVYSPETADPEFLRDAAAQYAEACAEANRRLRQVGQLLRKGLRSEALQLSEEEPNLLDFIGMLDFPELPGWSALLRQWDMAPPPALLIDLAADVNQAYAEHQPLESLLKQHRLLAMGRAPLAARIRNLRQIRRVDPANIAWEEDLKILESARIKQIDRELDFAFRRDDATALAKLKLELDDEWLSSRPAYLQNKAAVAYGDLSSRAARAELQSLEEELNSAHLSLDVEKGLQLKERWVASVGAAALPADDPIIERVSPALEWINAEEHRHFQRSERKRVIEELEDAVAYNAPINKVAKLFKSASTFDEPIPFTLKQRIEERLAAHATSAKRRRRIKWSSAVLAASLLIGLLAFLLGQQQKWARSASIADTLKSMINKEQLSEAQAFYDQSAASTPEIISGPAIQAQKTRLGAALKAETNRNEMFASVVARVNATSPTMVDRDVLAEALKLAKTSDEKKTVADIEAKVVAAEKRVQEEQDTALSEKLTEFERRVKEIQTGDSSDSKATILNLTELSSDVATAKSRFAKASVATIGPLDILTSQIKAIRESIESQNQQSASKDSITSSIGQAESYDAALAQFAKQFPDSDVASNLPLLQKESHLWQGFNEWTVFESGIFSPSEAVTSKIARDLLATGDKLGKTYADLELGERFKSRRRYLESIVAREPENDSPLLTELQKLFRDPLVGNLWIVVSNRNNGARFYSRSEPERKNESIILKYVAGFSLEEKSQSIRQSDVSYIDRAPQSVLAEQAAGLINGMAPRDWEKCFTTILSSISKEGRLDPILKIALLQKVLKTAAAGSSALGDGFADYRHQLETSKIDLSVNWMDPKDAAGQAERKRAELFLNGLPPIEDSIRATALSVRQFREPVKSKYTWIGWLSHSSGNSWNLESAGAKSENGELVVISKAAGDAHCGPATIGTIEESRVRFLASASSELLAGRPVFLRAKLESSK